MKMCEITKIEYRTVINFLTKEGYMGNHIKQRLDDVSFVFNCQKVGKCFGLGQEFPEVVQSTKKKMVLGLCGGILLIDLHSNVSAHTAGILQVAIHECDF